MSKMLTTEKKIEQGVASGFQAIENGVVSGYKAIENGVVNGYKKIENGVVSGYKKIENKFVEAFLSDGHNGDKDTAIPGENENKQTNKEEN